MSDKIPCFNCDIEINIDFRFCPNCGSKVKCKKCNTSLVKSAKFCFECGDSVDGENKKIDVENVNTIEFKETKEERSYKVSFTNETASQVTNVVAGMIPNGSNIFKKTLTTDLVEFSEIKDFEKSIQGENPEPIPVEIVDDKSESGKEEKKNDTDELNYHHIDDLPRKYENFSEKDWILVYAFYLSDFSKSYFTKENVHGKYKDARYTEARRKNFSKNWNDIFKGNFVTIKGNNLALNTTGINNAKNLLLGIQELKKNNKSSTQNKSVKSTTQISIKLEEFDIYHGKGLEKMINDSNLKSVKDYILCIGYYITFILKKEYFSDGNIDYAFKNLKLPKRPADINKSIHNIKTRNFLFENAGVKKWKLSRKGEIEFEKMLNNGN